MTGWFKSSKSNPSGNCVEVSLPPPGAVRYGEIPGDGEFLVGVRDSKAPDGPVHKFSAEAWAAFLASVKGCPDCEGRGRVRLYARSRWEPCGLCAGKGRMTG